MCERSKKKKTAFTMDRFIKSVTKVDVVQRKKKKLTKLNVRTHARDLTIFTEGKKLIKISQSHINLRYCGSGANVPVPK